jgi:hypothetical protein
VEVDSSKRGGDGFIAAVTEAEGPVAAGCAGSATNSMPMSKVNISPPVPPRQYANTGFGRYPDSFFLWAFSHGAEEETKHYGLEGPRWIRHYIPMATSFYSLNIRK